MGYVLATLAYGAVAVSALAISVLALSARNWVLLAVALLAIYVSMDNFFCGSRARAAGCDVKGHYCVPPFLRR